MSKLYAESHRALQDRHGTRRLADLLDQAIVHDTLTPQDIAFIEAQDMFFLATVDAAGRPTVSYKGGGPGFLNAQGGDIVFPCYDGNGMFYSMGNLMQHAEVGMLFIDFVTPNRLRVQGIAHIDDGPARSDWPGALFVVRVTPTHVFVNCGRYIHPKMPVGQSPHVPGLDGHQPVAAWKRIDIVQDSLPSADQEAALKAGPISQEEYEAKVARGES